MLTNYPKLTDAEIGSNLSRPLLLSAIEENTDRNGKAFVKVTLKDGFSDVTALMFATSAADLEARLIVPNTVVDADLAVSEYQGNKSYKVSNLAPAADKLLSISDFVKLPPVDLDVMYDEIISMLEAVADNYENAHTPLSDLAIRILTKYKDSYMTSSAAISMHHNLRGGLLYHSYRMVKAADALCGVYTSLDRELLLCGAALHDIGKIWEYSTSEAGDAAFTSSGVLFGHLYMGASLIKGFSHVKDTAPYHSEKVQLLIHLILAHHGTQEWGTVACPAIPEAMALHYIDNLDAKMYMFEEQYETLDAGELSDKKPFGLDNRVYRPKYNSQS